MKEYCKNILFPTLLLLSFLGDCILYFYCKVIEGQVFAIIFASIATTYYAFLKQKIENDKMFKDLFESFNTKYNGETNDIFNELRRCQKEKSINDIDKELVKTPEKRIEEIKPNGENIVIDYFNLCAEEYLWFSKGRIPKKVWDAWKCGIIANINEIQQVKELYKDEIKNNEQSFYGLVKELDIKI